MHVSGKTKITGIFGYPIEHTLSPFMHNAAFESLGMDICYIAFKVSPEALQEAVQAVRCLDLLGVNITVPHKETVLPLLDRIHEEASFIGAVNTITNSGGMLTGYNTDGRGFLSSLSEEGIETGKKKICIVGAGGASRAISYYLSENASELYLYDIDGQKAGKLVNDLNKIRSNVRLLKQMNEIGKPDIIINATPLGLKPDDPLPIDPDIITPDMTICDLVYRKTGLLREAERRKAKILDGAGMLLWQGVLAFELWTETKPPVEIMRKALMSRIQ